MRFLGERRKRVSFVVQNYDFSWFIAKSLFIWNNTPYLLLKRRKFIKRNGFFEKLCDGEHQLSKWRRDIICCVQKYLYFLNLWGCWYLFEIVHSSPTVKNTKNVLVSRNHCDGEHEFFLKRRRATKVLV